MYVNKKVQISFTLKIAWTDPFGESIKTDQEASDNHTDNRADNRADNWADNWGDNWADNWADVNEKKLCLFKRKKKM